MLYKIENSIKSLKNEIKDSKFWYFNERVLIDIELWLPYFEYKIHIELIHIKVIEHVNWQKTKKDKKTNKI